MTTEELEYLRYPIGKFVCPETISESHLIQWIEILEGFPEKLKELIKDLTDDQLDTPYRDGGWTIRQVVHHVSDSHHHSYIRFKWALTENKPKSKIYYEKLWAELDDARSGPVGMSLDHLTAVHKKLVYLLRSLSISEMSKSFIHPDYKTEISLKVNTGIYAWHSQHHYAHIKNIMIRKGWI